MALLEATPAVTKTSKLVSTVLPLMATPNLREPAVVKKFSEKCGQRIDHDSGKFERDPPRALAVAANGSLIASLRDPAAAIPRSPVHSAAGLLLRPGSTPKATASEMESDAVKMFDPLCGLAVQLRDPHETFVHSYAF